MESFKVMDIGQLFDPYCIWNYRPCFWVESGLDQIYSRRGVWSNALYKKAFDRLSNISDQKGFSFVQDQSWWGECTYFLFTFLTKRGHPGKIAEI